MFVHGRDLHILFLNSCFIYNSQGTRHGAFPQGQIFLCFDLKFMFYFQNNSCLFYDIM